MEQSNEQRGAQAEAAAPSFFFSPLCRFDSRGDYLVEDERDQLAVGLSFLLRLAYRAHTCPREVAREGLDAMGPTDECLAVDNNGLHVRVDAIALCKRALWDITWNDSKRSPARVAREALAQIGGAL